MFDPLATGLPPTGHMILLPAATDLLTGGLKSLASVFADPSGSEEFDAVIDGYFNASQDERNSLRATRNVSTLQGRLSELGDTLDQLGDSISDIDFESWSGFIDPVGSAAASGMQAYEQVDELTQRLDACFVDCSDSFKLYSDIYAGLLDIVELRAATAAQLALTRRFHESLIVGKLPPSSESGLVYGLIGGLAGKMLPKGGAAKEKVDSRKAAIAANQQKRAEKEKEQDKPRLYMHPRTVCLYNDTIPTTGQLVVFPRGFVSNDDSNVVVSQLSDSPMNFAALISGKVGEIDTISERVTLGDGRVPLLSAKPDPEMISNPFIADHRVPGVEHSMIPGDEDGVKFVCNHLEEALPEFMTTG